MKPPKITVLPLISRPALDTNRSLREIQAMASEDREKYSSTDHEISVGLTAASLKLDSRFEVQIHQSPYAQDVCAQISEFELRFGFQETTVYVAREIPAGSCSYETVMGHEGQHVDMDTYLVRTSAQRFPDMLQKAVSDIGMIRAASPGAAQDRLREIVRDYMDGLGRNLAAVRQKYQQTIDTRDEYSRISNSCNGELSEILRRNAPLRKY
jgi:hypothetical protein